MPGVSTYDDLPTLDGESFWRLAEVVYRYTGIRLGPGKAYFVVGRLGRMYRCLGCDGWGDLANRLETASPALIDALVQAVITAETRFFRDDLPFRALTETIAPALASVCVSPAPLRIWSAGCSTGQEPYSVVMALWDFVERGRLDLDVWATDICKASLEWARRGVYERFELGRGLPAETRDRFFEETAGGAARVRDEIRARVRFDRLNLLAEIPERGVFHVVFCRNVAIYFDRPGKEHLYHALAKTVLPGGYLILGAAETLLPSVEGFETVYFDRCLLFQKKLRGA